MVLIINLKRTSLVIQALCERDYLRVSKLLSVLSLDSCSRVIKFSIPSIRVASVQVVSECEVILGLYRSYGKFNVRNFYVKKFRVKIFLSSKLVLFVPSAFCLQQLLSFVRICKIALAGL